MSKMNVTEMMKLFRAERKGKNLVRTFVNYESMNRQQKLDFLGDNQEANIAAGWSGKPRVIDDKLIAFFDHHVSALTTAKPAGGFGTMLDVIEKRRMQRRIDARKRALADPSDKPAKPAPTQQVSANYGQLGGKKKSRTR